MLEGRQWYRFDGASTEALAELRAASSAELPDSYLRLLAFSDGGEGPLPVNPFNLCLDPAREVTNRLRDTEDGQAEFDGFLIIGGNGGGEYIALDIRGDLPWPVVTIDMTVGRDSAERIANDFDTFLGLIGVEE
jgi:hypothetical protein